MKSLKLAPMCLLIGGLALFGCAVEEPVEEPVVDTATPATPVPGATDTQAMIWIDDPTLGSQVGADGSIPLGSTDNDFEPGDPIYVAMEVGDAPAGANVRVVWYGQGGQILHEETKPVAGTYMNFQAPETTNWAVGDYRVEIFANGAKAHEEDFNIEAAGNIG